MLLTSIHKYHKALPVIMILMLSLAISGCKGKKTGESEFLQTPGTESTDQAKTSTSSTDSSQAPGEPSQYSTSKEGQEIGGVKGPKDASASGLAQAAAIRAEGRPVPELSMVNFDYDKFDVRDDAKPTLEANAQWMKANPTVQINIEGHCDERGTADYNMTLGQKRADTVREYLVGLGIDASRLHTLSWGKERPLDPADNPEAHAKNRRVQFLAMESK